MKKKYHTISFLAFFFLTAFAAWAIEPPPPLEALKWQQRPDMEHGINSDSKPPNITVADDWICLDGSPLTDLHFWGSYIGWYVTKSTPPELTPGIEKFRIQLYSDAPTTTPTGFSRPNNLLYEVWVDNFKETYEASIPVTWPPGTEIEHKYRYDMDLPRIFWQKRDRTYWLSISAIPRDLNFPWGWESAMDRWNDFAVSGYYNTPDDWFWNPINNPMIDEYVDVSFELSTCGGPIKWLQFPGLANGVNIPSFPENNVVADDWLCTDGKPITEIHFWGSYLGPDGQEHWEVQNSGPPSNALPAPPGVKSFKLSFHKDVPAGDDEAMPWSHPGELIRELSIDYGDLEERYWDSIPHTDAFGIVLWEHKFYYIAHLNEPFQQKEGTVYWLDIVAVPLVENSWAWGWETSHNHWNDNAVRGDGNQWLDLGEIYGSPVDMAFLLMTEDDTPYCEGDYDRDGDVDGIDLAIFAEDFGWTDCHYSGNCKGDVDYDGDVDKDDLIEFAADFDRADCPCGLPKK